MIHQPSVERALRTNLVARSEAALHSGWELGSFLQDEDGITADMSTPEGPRTIRARWLVGADGARSPVRKHLGVAFDDLGFEEPWLVVDVLVDGAHSPGQVPVDLTALDPTYFVGSLHKWISAPKGTAFLYVAPHKREGFRPVFLSSRGHKIRPDRALFLRDFDYHGTLDYSGFLVVPEAIAYLGRLLPGGWPELIQRNHELALKGRAIVCEAIGCAPAAPDSLIGSMASIILPEAAPEMQSRTTIYDDPLQDNLVHKHGVVTPIWRLASTNQRVVRLSAQAYNTVDQYETLAEALVTELRAEGAIPSTTRRAG
jgi:selenocysteine lyase/cysteine desulfurase